MNSPFRVRLRARAPASASPRPGLPAAPVAPSFRLGVQKYIFFSNRQTFSQKFFEKFLSAAPAPSASLPPLPRSRETGPQKYCFFTIRQTFFKEIFEKFLNPLTVSIKKNARILIDSPTERGSGLQNAPPISTSPGLAPWEMTRIFPENRHRHLYLYRLLLSKKKAQKTQMPPAPHNRQAVQPYFAIRIRASTATTCLALPNRGLISIS